MRFHCQMVWWCCAVAHLRGNIVCYIGKRKQFPRLFILVFLIKLTILLSSCQLCCSACIRPGCVIRKFSVWKLIFKVALEACIIRRTTSAHTPSQVDEDDSDRIGQITLNWFKLIAANPIDAVLALCKQPFLDIRCSGFDLVSWLRGGGGLLSSSAVVATR